jgi:hypothetical protein
MLACLEEASFTSSIVRSCQRGRDSHFQGHNLLRNCSRGRPSFEYGRSSAVLVERGVLVGTKGRAISVQNFVILDTVLIEGICDSFRSQLRNELLYQSVIVLLEEISRRDI